ncbi:MAG TPA: methylmalonyl-CoA mutase, partial [Caldithrix sp.]|nr:methylmalonyl-CoA mutase [Caldithrix sp.]
GSYFVEYLTDQIEKKVTEYLEKIEAMGGAVEAVKSKYFQNEIAQSAYRYQQKVEQGEEVVVGVNKFTVVEKDTPPILEIDERQVRNQILRLKKLRAQRNRQRVQESLQHLESAARGSENLMPRIIDCVEQYATVGEIANTLRGVFGEYRE